MRSIRVGLIVPELRLEGGIKNHAYFVLQALEAIPGLHIEIASLAMSSNDEASTKLLKPSSWFSHERTIPIHVWGREVQHFGTRFVELELMRFAKRPALTQFALRQDVLAIVSGAPCWALSVLDLGVPVVLTVASLTKLERQGHASKMTVRDLSRAVLKSKIDELDDRSISRASHVVVENKLMKSYCSNLRPKGGVTLAPPGVDTNLFKPGPSASPSFILYVGRFSDPRKNVKHLISAYRILRSNHGLGVPIIFAGSGQLNLEEFADDSLVRTIQNPSNEELASLYRTASIVALPSKEEGFGFVVVEAMASGTPVVSTRCGGPEDIISDGIDGFLVDVNDPSDMARALARLWRDDLLRDRFRNAALQTVALRFSVSATQLAHQNVYDDVFRAAGLRM